MPYSTLKIRMILVLTATAACISSAPFQVHTETEAKQEKISPPLKFYDTDDDGYVVKEEAANENARQNFSKVSMLTGMETARRMSSAKHRPCA